MRIIKISGYGPGDQAYQDKLTITPSSISYECKPLLQENSRFEGAVKWSYKTNNKLFSIVFSQIAEMTPYYLYNDEDLFATDIGPVSITATFEDKHRETENYFCPPSFFRDYFNVIKQLVPAVEDVPIVLRTGEEGE